MSINIGPPAIDELRPRITVIGVGGAGGNAIANMIGAGIEGVDFVVCNTDAQALNNSIAENRIQLGPAITQGLGAGARPKWAAPRRKKPCPSLSACSMACTWCSSPPAWAAAPAPAPRR
jgi:cell division protein FtsZ